jgi:hypothetical protein
VNVNEEVEMAVGISQKFQDRRDFIGGSDARIIMGQDGNASIHVHRRLKNPHKS